MKRALPISAILLFLTAFAFAANQSKHAHLTFMIPVTAGNAQLGAGDYKASWDATAAVTQVTFAQQGKELGPVAARIVPGEHPHDGAILTTEVSGANVLQEIQFRHFSLVFTTEAAATATGGPATD